MTIPAQVKLDDPAGVIGHGEKFGPLILAKSTCPMGLFCCTAYVRFLALSGHSDALLMSAFGGKADMASNATSAFDPKRT